MGHSHYECSSKLARSLNSLANTDLKEWHSPIEFQGSFKISAKSGQNSTLLFFGFFDQNAMTWPLIKPIGLQQNFYKRYGQSSTTGKWNGNESRSNANGYHIRKIGLYIVFGQVVQQSGVCNDYPRWILSGPNPGFVFQPLQKSCHGLEIGPLAIPRVLPRVGILLAIARYL